MLATQSITFEQEHRINFRFDRIMIHGNSPTADRREPCRHSQRMGSTILTLICSYLLNLNKHRQEFSNLVSLTFYADINMSVFFKEFWYAIK
jgi:hypothetical protein